MKERERFYIVIKWHYNPTTNEVGKKKNLPVLMFDSNGDPLEFNSLDSANEFLEIMNINTNQGFRYEVREIGRRFTEIKTTQHDT
jgi:hypothetical protein|tara:strand:+ start:2628 stop:2882 length:255 start_codon:yes stop_codon:yes gene_type:complete